MMRVLTWINCTILAALLLTGTAIAQNPGPTDDEGYRYYITPFVGWTFFDSDRLFANGLDLNDDAYWGGRAGARLTKRLWLDVAGGYTGIKDCRECIERWTHYSANLMLAQPSHRLLNPFISLGGGWSNYKDARGTSENTGTLEAAAGLHVRVSDAIGIRLEARDILSLSKSKRTNERMNDIVVGAGLTLGFGGKPKVVEQDSDGDGVYDSGDNCPDTPRGCRVDIYGCPIDSDGDGVCDGIDQCPDTPRGCLVDARGCPIDSDGDGVCDGLDTCPNTPQGCLVDASGCPLDSDGDGVCDGLDNCASTPAGSRVDKDGCPIAGRELELEMELLNTGMLRISDIHFDLDKSTIRPDAYAVLDTVGRVLTKWEGLEIKIDGHTDSRASDAYNLSLSNRRSASVRAYLLEHFPQFQPSQITSEGFGESQPLVPNTSEVNMQANRRVEFVVLNKEILEIPK